MRMHLGDHYLSVMSAKYIAQDIARYCLYTSSVVDFNFNHRIPNKILTNNTFNTLLVFNVSYEFI